MADIPQYKSTLTGTEIDAAMKKMAENEIGDFVVEKQLADYVLKSALLDLVYPVGSVYISYNSASPAALFGGTWEQIQGQFLLASSESYPAGSTGGEATHTLTVSEMPSHNHILNASYSSAGSSSSVEGKMLAGDDNNGWIWNHSATNNTGDGAAHNNMPPYLAVYMWQRTA